MTVDVHQYCEEKAAKSGSSFYYSFKVLPLEKRQAITALYAFCREVDDVVDECTEVAIAEKKLQWWREEVDNLFNKNPQHPVTQALLPAISQFNLAKEYFIEILDGMHMDLNYAGYQSFNDLRLYCYRVASAVGLLAIEIFGYTNRQTIDYAHNLGLALQLTNILRDVREDAMRNRVYIPIDEMELYKVSPEAFLKKETKEALFALFSLQAQRARSYYEKAMQALPDEDRFSQLAGLIMAEIYLALLKEIEQDGFKVLEYRVKLTPLRKLWIAFKVWFRENKLKNQLEKKK